MKISELIKSKDLETCLLGLRSLPEDFFDWIKTDAHTFNCITGNEISYRSYANIIQELLNSDEVCRSDVFSWRIYYKTKTKCNYISQASLIELVVTYENIRPYRSEQSRICFDGI